MIKGDAEGRIGISGATLPGSDRKSRGGEDGASRVTARRRYSHPETLQLMEAVVERENMKAAWRRVKGNKGAPGVDGMTVDALLPYLRERWSGIKEDLLAGRYQPSPVRKVEIPKPGGGMRQLGIPTVLDRLIQQALHQVLQPSFDPAFSASSYGFRPGRGALQALAQAKASVAAGKRWVVDLDLEKFFDRVNHDILMARLARKITDKRVLRLIRRYLQAGMMESGDERQL
jgi:RNA-directed DNA polymerase